MSTAACGATHHAWLRGGHSSEAASSQAITALTTGCGITQHASYKTRQPAGCHSFKASAGPGTMAGTGGQPA